MYKQSPSRNQRSKGIKGKHILQLCVLLVVCFWLIYQVKHSQDKRKEFESKDEKYMEKMKTDGEIQRLGRKDLPATGLATDVDRHGEDEEEKEPEEEENKHSEDELGREEGSTGENEEVKASGGDEDGEKDENEPEKADAEPEDEKEKEVKDTEENERESEENHIESEKNEAASEDSRAENEENEGESEENTENEENEEVTKDDQPETEDNEIADTEDRSEHEEKEDVEKDHDDSDATVEDQAHDGGRTSTREAQEELYKADDASSEVAHNVQTIIPEAENVTAGHENELRGNTNSGLKNETRSSDEDNAGVQQRVGEVMVNNGTVSNATVTEQKKYEGNSTESENKDLPENGEISTTAGGGQTSILLPNEAQISAGSNKSEIVNTNNGESSSSSNTTSVSSHETNGTDAMSAGLDSLLTKVRKSEKSETLVSEKTSEHQSYDEEADTILHDPIDVSDTEEDTQPEIRNEVQNNNGTVTQ